MPRASPPFETSSLIFSDFLNLSDAPYGHLKIHSLNLPETARSS